MSVADEIFHADCLSVIWLDQNGAIKLSLLETD